MSFKSFRFTLIDQKKAIHQIQKLLVQLQGGKYDSLNEGTNFYGN